MKRKLYSTQRFEDKSSENNFMSFDGFLKKKHKIRFDN